MEFGILSDAMKLDKLQQKKLDIRLKRQKWDRRYLEMAKLVSTWSKDPSTTVGAVIVGPTGAILSTGYNGFPKGIADDSVRFQDRDTKLHYTIHGEMNALYNALQHGVNVNGAILYCTFPICSECAKGIIQSGISCVVIPYLHVNPGRIKWFESWKKSCEMFEEAGVDRRVLF